MSSDNNITGGASPLTLDGTEYRLSRLDDSDFSELDEWVQDRIVNLAVRMLERTPRNAKDRDEILSGAYRAAAGMTWMSGEGAKMMGTIDGVTRILWQSVRKNHPDVTLKELRKHLFSATNVAKVWTKIKIINDLESKKGTTSTEGPDSQDNKSTEDSPKSTPGPPL